MTDEQTVNRLEKLAEEERQRHNMDIKTEQDLRELFNEILQRPKNQPFLTQKQYESIQQVAKKMKLTKTTEETPQELQEKLIKEQEQKLKQYEKATYGKGLTAIEVKRQGKIKGNYTQILYKDKKGKFVSITRTQTYAHRIESYLQRHPEATLAEARGHKKK